MDFYDEMFPEDPATAEWMRVCLRQDRPAATARAEAWWAKADERQQAYVYDRTVNGQGHSQSVTEADRGRWPAPPYVTADFADIFARASHICRTSDYE